MRDEGGLINDTQLFGGCGHWRGHLGVLEYVRAVYRKVQWSHTDGDLGLRLAFRLPTPPHAYSERQPARREKRVVTGDRQVPGATFVGERFEASRRSCARGTAGKRAKSPIGSEGCRASRKAPTDPTGMLCVFTRGQMVRDPSQRTALQRF